MRGVGLVGPAAPWAGGIARFTSDLAAQLRTRGDVCWLSWRTPRRHPPPGTEVDLTATPDPLALPLLGLLDRGSWRAAGERLQACPVAILIPVDGGHMWMFGRWDRFRHELVRAAA